jgi:hypothetical protein
VVAIAGRQRLADGDDPATALSFTWRRRCDVNVDDLSPICRAPRLPVCRGTPATLSDLASPRNATGSGGDRLLNQDQVQGRQMMNTLHRGVHEERLEIHNIEVNTAVAAAHRCGMTHMATGRVCLLPERHLGGCDFRGPADLRSVLGRT